ncbi:MAG: DUF4623 domain-containing protein, partial [Verrucomicrobia bacterium]|nr:DUF4623 domain-containing protein [Verrucomicrobiota bacterium]
DLIIVSRNVGDFIAVIDALTGTEKTYLDTSLVSGGTFDINMVGVADDGAVYVGNLTTSASSSPFILYRWADDSGSSPVTVAFSGDPGATSYPGLRWGDNMAVRGSGPNTQVILAPVFTTNTIVSLLQTTDGINFTATPILLTNVPAGFAQVGLAFGPGTNTFYGKKSGGALYLVQFDLASQTGFAKEVYSSSAVPLSVTAIGTSPTLHLLAGLDASVVPNRVPLYNIADPTRDPAIEDQKGINVVSDNSTLGGVGAVTVGQNYLFVLDSNNGIAAYQIDTNYAALTPFRITQFTDAPGSLPVLSWTAEAGHMYQAQCKNSLEDPAWSLVGVPTLAGGSSLSVTNILLPGVGTSNRVYRVLGF